MSASLWGEPMRSKGLGWTLGALGVVLVAAGLVLMLAIVPSMKKLRPDTNVTRGVYQHHAGALRPADVQFMRNLPITLSRHFAVLKTNGNVALVKEERTMMSGGSPGANRGGLATDRSTRWLTPTKYPSHWAQTEGFWPRQGIVLRSADRQPEESYPGWSDDYPRSVAHLRRRNHLLRSGTKVYLYTSSSGPKPIDPRKSRRWACPRSCPRPSSRPSSERPR